MAESKSGMAVGEGVNSEYEIPEHCSVFITSAMLHMWTWCSVLKQCFAFTHSGPISQPQWEFNSNFFVAVITGLKASSNLLGS